MSDVDEPHASNEPSAAPKVGKKRQKKDSLMKLPSAPEALVNSRTLSVTSNSGYIIYYCIANLDIVTFDDAISLFAVNAILITKYRSCLLILYELVIKSLMSHVTYLSIASVTRGLSNKAKSASLTHEKAAPQIGFPISGQYRRHRTHRLATDHVRDQPITNQLPTSHEACLYICLH